MQPLGSEVVATVGQADQVVVLRSQNGQADNLLAVQPGHPGEVSDESTEAAREPALPGQGPSSQMKAS